jgi:hypothetical protein
MDKKFILAVIAAVLVFYFMRSVQEYFSDPYFAIAKQYCEGTYRGRVTNLVVNGREKSVCSVPGRIGMGLEPKLCDLNLLVQSQSCVNPL